MSSDEAKRLLAHICFLRRELNVRFHYLQYSDRKVELDDPIKILDADVHMHLRRNAVFITARMKVYYDAIHPVPGDIRPVSETPAVDETQKPSNIAQRNTLSFILVKDDAQLN
ncbi:unnamed protein product [Didymodactylos carnosus]|uniref:Uncharacterized protein n=1 Tax=Didymodactylos carnosus TaxID=1234261 RepID=A0A814EPS7_9BILA|nr:unnamed protein product [Didymodactylos carnosus]CAF3745085.1 unnamed protein product [Didymodactylos carnosus]